MKEFDFKALDEMDEVVVKIGSSAYMEVWETSDGSWGFNEFSNDLKLVDGGEFDDYEGPGSLIRNWAEEKGFSLSEKNIHILSEDEEDWFQENKEE